MDSKASLGGEGVRYRNGRPVKSRLNDLEGMAATRCCSARGGLTGVQPKVELQYKSA